METVFVECIGNIQNLDRPQEFEVFLRTSQTKWKTSKMVSEATRLQLHITAYSREDKHQGRYSIKKRSSEYKRG